VRRLGVLFYDPGHRFQPPVGTAARAAPTVVQCCRYAAKRVALVAQTPNLRKCGLLSRVWLQKVSLCMLGGLLHGAALSAKTLRIPEPLRQPASGSPTF
jgi:hypothetical protein